MCVCVPTYIIIIIIIIITLFPSSEISALQIFAHTKCLVAAL